MSYSGSERGITSGLGVNAPTKATINVRLNGALDRLISLNRNLNHVIDNVEGRPSQEQGGNVAKLPSDNRPMMSAIETLEAEVERLHELTRHFEQIA